VPDGSKNHVKNDSQPTSPTSTKT